jgi:ElaB/YqjD/DUF883 family membrane-anchored ribosome-binding protein
MDDRFSPQIDDTKTSAGGMVDDTKNRASAMVDETKKRAGAMAQGAADAVVNAASKASDTVSDMAGQVKRVAGDSAAGRSAASLADEAAKRFGGAADYVRDTEPEDMWDDFVTAVRTRPVQSLAAAALLGFIAGRAARRM